MKISGVDIRPGNILEYERGIWKVAKIQHTQPGKGGAYMQVEMKNLQDGRKTNVRFRSADTIERVRLDTKDFQYLYNDGGDLVFMDQDTYEQIHLPADLIGDAAAFLQDGMEVSLELWEDKPISVQLPEQVEAKVHLRRDLVYVLSARAGRARRRPLQIRRGNRLGQAIDVQVVHNG